MVPPIPYLEWIDGRPEAATHDLGSSDLRAVAGEWDVAPEVLRDRPGPPPDVTLDEQVAEIYDVAPEEVLVSPGAGVANLAAMAAALEDGRGVIVEQPGYEPLVATAEWLGARVSRFQRPADAGYRMDPAHLASVTGPATTLVATTNRHNPSGRLLGRETLSANAAVAEASGGRLLVDEVYAPYAAEAGDGPFGGPTAAGLENVVVTGSLTKFFGLGGLRVGWLVAEAGFVERARRVTYHVPALARPSVALASRALHNRDDLAERARTLVGDNAGLLADFVDERDDLSGTVEDGATFAFLAHEEADGREVATAAEAADVLVVPGSFFDDPGRFRVSLGRTPSAMQSALDALDQALDGL